MVRVHGGGSKTGEFRFACFALAVVCEFSLALMAQSSGPRPDFIPILPGFFHQPGSQAKTGVQSALVPRAPALQASQGTFTPVLAPSLDASATFIEAPVYGSGAPDAMAVLAADVNGDGKPDLLVVNQCLNSVNCNSGTVGVLLGNGDGTFQSAVTFGTAGFEPLSVAVGDLNGDGKLDLVIANYCTNSTTCTSGSVSVLLGNGNGTFQKAVSYASGGENAYSVALGDFNGDGKLDVAVANYCANASNCSAGGGVAVLLGNGDGTLQSAVSYGSGGQDAVALAVADLNGDHKPDIVVANYCASSPCAGGSVSVLLGNGNGTFQSAVSYASGGLYALSVATGDVNGDGKTDVVVDNGCATSDCSTGGAAGVLLGNGDGTLQTAVPYGSGGVDPRFVDLADVNGDGKLDVLVGNQCANNSNCSLGSIGVLLNSGNGTFQTAASYGTAGRNVFGVAVADVNGDGKADLLAANECASSSSCSSGTVSVLPGTGNGTFSAAVDYSSGGQDVYSTAVADINGDGKPDLLVANYCFSSASCDNGGLGVLLGNGDGTFQAASSYSSGGQYAESLGVGDVNGDGKLDAVVANNCASSIDCSDGTLSVLLGNGDGTFQSAVSYSSGGYQPVSTALADVNGDRKLDIVVANNCATSSNCNNGQVSVLIGNGDGTFKTAVSYGSGGYMANAVAVADVNGDGKPDVLVANGCISSTNCTNGEVDVLLGNGDGTFRNAVGYSSGAYTAYALAVADVNSDGKLDLLVANNCQSSTSCSNGALSVLLGNGDGTFQAAQVFLAPQIGLGALAVADFNGDGKLDVASGGGDFLLLGNGDGTFQNSLYLGAAGVGIAVGDFNRDGSPDLAVGSATILLNRFSRIVATTTTVASSLNPSTYGQLVKLSATVTANGSGTPTGSITFKDGSSTLATVTLVNGAASYSTSTLTAGSHSISGVYSGDSNFQGSTGNVSQVVNKASSATALSSSVNPSSYGQSVMLTATVTSSAGIPTGSVTFNDGSTSLGSAAVQNGTAGLSVKTLAVGTHSITAVYGGDANFAGSTSNALHQMVNAASTATTVTSSANPAAKGQVVTYTASVSGSFGGALTGTVTLKDGATTLGTFPVGQANYSTSYTKTGSHPITAVYSGDANNQGSTSPVFTEYIEILPVATTTTMATSGSPSIINQLVTFTATVTSSFGKIPDGETVTFYDGTTKMGTGLTASGVATFSTSTLSAKTHTIKGTYAGDASFKTSSDTIQQIVNGYSTTTTLSANPNPSAFGQLVTLTATVKTTGSATPTGNVTFFSGSTSLGNATLNSSGTATLKTAKLSVGSDSLTATYNGDSLNESSTSAIVTETVNPAKINLTLTSSPNPSNSGQKVTFTAKLTSNGGLPNGQTVSFTFNGNTLGTGTITAGKAIFSTTTLPAGSDTVTASYAGDGTHSSASGFVVQTVN